MQPLCQNQKIIVSRLFVMVNKFHNLQVFRNYDEKCRKSAIECGEMATEQIYSATLSSTMRVLALSYLAEKVYVELPQRVIFSASIS
jgi:hypothetical protein